MTCDVWRDKLERYADSELPESELKEMESHVRTCSSCAAEALGKIQLKRMTQAAGTRYSPTPQFRLRIEQSIKPKRRSFGAFSGLPAFAAAGALLAVLVLASVLWIRHSRYEHAVTELADLHVSTLASANPVDVVSTDRHTVKPWFAGKLPFTFNVPELQGTPFKLVGGRVAYFEHNPGAQLLFDVGKHQISVFIFQDNGTTPFGAGTRSTSKLAFNMETWAEGDLRYVIISDAGRSDLQALGKLFRLAANS